MTQRQIDRILNQRLREQERNLKIWKRNNADCDWSYKGVPVEIKDTAVFYNYDTEDYDLVADIGPYEERGYKYPNHWVNVNKLLNVTVFDSSTVDLR